MENIKDLKLIIGPLNAEQWKEVTAWCDETSICEYKFAEANINPTIFVRYTYHYTDQDIYYAEEDSSHEKLTYQQWYDRFIKKSRVLPEMWYIKVTKENQKIVGDWILKNDHERFINDLATHPSYADDNYYFRYPRKEGNSAVRRIPKGYTEISFDQFQRLVLKQDVKQHKEEVMNKQDFVIKGSISLKKAFVEETGLPTFSSNSIQSDLTSWDNKGFQGTGFYRPDAIVFNLPSDWTKALEYVKEYFKEEPKFKAGDYITVIKNFPADANISNLELEGTYKISESGTRVNDVPFKGLYDITHCFRLATPQEILDTLVKESGFKVGDNIKSLDKDYYIKGVIKKFYVDVYVTKDTDDKFLYVTLENGKSYVTTNFYGAPQFKLYNPTKTLVLGDKKIKVKISRGEIWAEGRKLSIELVEEAIGAMTGEELDWDYNSTDWLIKFPNIQIGCTTLSLDEVKLIKKTYEELND